MAQVYNVKGSIAHKPPGKLTSWKDYWIREKRQQGSKATWPAECTVQNCPKRTAGGAHVAYEPKIGYVQSGGNTNIYIAPLCSDHNNPNAVKGIEVAKRYLCYISKDGKPQK